MESLFDSIKEQFPTMTTEEHKELGKLTLGWVTLLGTTSVKRLEHAKANNTEHLEERAQFIAFNTMLSVFYSKLKDEVDSLSAVTTTLQMTEAVHGEGLTP